MVESRAKRSSLDFSFNIMENTFYRPDILPDVCLRVIHVLEEGKSPISLTLSNHGKDNCR